MPNVVIPCMVDTHRVSLVTLPRRRKVSNSEIRRASPATERVFGVILAGGKSRRFGRPKVLAALGGAPMASWGVRALQAAGLPVGVISNEDGVEAVLGVRFGPIWRLDSARSGGFGPRSSGPGKGATTACCFSDVICPS